MIYLYYKTEYGNVFIGEVMTNHSMSVQEVLEQLGIDMDEFAKDQGWDNWDPDALTLTKNKLRSKKQN